jgi:hypothetical protein
MQGKGGRIMNPQDLQPVLHQLVVVRSEPDGQFTAEAVGIPEVRVTCAERSEAIKRVRLMLCDWVISGRLVQIDVPQRNPLLDYAGWAKDDPSYEAYLEELRRFRQEDLERTLREYDQECSDSSSTPTT